MTDNTANIAHSVHQRLLNLARKTGQDFNRLLVRYSLERLLYRLSQSKHADRFILKGAMVFAVWSDQQYRATQDLDLLGARSSSPDELIRVFCEIVLTAVPVADGMAYLADAITAEPIREDMAYGGIRVQMQSRLGNARIPLTIDVGFGDAVTPPAQEGQFPVLLDTPPPIIRTYPREAVIAEKLEAMVALGEGNSRMKDFADLWFLAQHFDFDGQLLAKAVGDTFHRRQTPPESQPIALMPAFAQIEAKQAQWKAFLRRSSPKGTPIDLAEVVDAIATFLLPILAHLAADEPLPRTWDAPGPWQM